ncbi:hypothetical protein B296_00055234, partial [Ensete ventricosum]
SFCPAHLIIVCSLLPLFADSNNLYLLVQNIGDDDFNVKIWGTPALHIDYDIGPLSRNISKKVHSPFHYHMAFLKLFRKRGKRDDSGIPYQQLEMGAQPQSSSAAESNTVDGWDEWDDDWDDEAVTRPQKHTTTSVSPNGLSSRTPKKDVWDADWDD